MTKKPVVLVTGVHPAPMDSAVVALQWDLPSAVVVRHRIDAERGVLERVVSDATGELERVEVDLAHACVTCAVREDVVPTLLRLATDDRWASIVAHLPVSASAEHVCEVVAADEGVAEALRVSAVLVALDGVGLEEDLVGDDLLAERGLAAAHDDRRGVGEVAADLVEHSDAVVVHGDPHPAGLDLVRLLARPDAEVVLGVEHLGVDLVTTARHEHSRTRAWVSPLATADRPEVAAPRAWCVDLRSERPFHPQRLLAGLERLGGGRHRSKGCFRLPHRPAPVIWRGAGGQVSIGNGTWHPELARQTRLVICGTHTAPAHLRETFESMLLQPGEHCHPQPEDGFEQWLGPVHGPA